MTAAVGAPGYDEAMLVIVPSRDAAAREAARRLGAIPESDLGCAAVWTHDIVTLRELVERAAPAVSAPPVLRGAAHQLLIAELVEAPGSRARGLLGAGPGAAGVARACAAAIAELRMAELTAADVERAAGEARAASRRLAALADILSRYEERLERDGLWDAARLHREIVALVEAGGWPHPVDRLEIRGLYDVTPLQGRLLTALALRVAGSTRVIIPFDSFDDAATAYAFPYLHMWESIEHPSRDITLELLPEWPEGAAADVALESAIDPADEARRVADWVRSRAEQGAPLEEIAVVTAGPGRAAPLARELLRRGIEFHARRSTQLAETPLFAALLLPFRLFEEGFRRADLLAWVTSPLTTRLDPDLLRPALARGPAGGGTLGEWHRALGSARGESAAVLNSVLRDLHEIARGELTPERFWSTYLAVIGRVGLGPDEGAGETPLWAAWEDVLRELRAALDLVGAWSGPAVPWRTHRRHLSTALGERRASQGRPGRGISIVTVRDARGLRFRHAALPGLVQGALLAPRGSAALLGDEERAALNEALGRSLFRLAAEDAREGALLLRERLQGTAERCLLLYPTTDGDGNPLLPALELEELRRRLGLAGGGAPAPDPAWRLDRDPERVAAIQRMERIRTAFFAREPARPAARHDGAFAPAAVEALRRELEPGGALGVWSASRLEVWRQCPHRWFQRYALRLEPPEELVLEAEPTTIGRVVHLALKELLADPDGNGPIDRDRIEEALRQASEDPTIPALDRGHGEVWKAVLRRAAGVIERYFRHVAEKHPPSGMTTVEREIAFGPDKELSGVAVETSLGALPLRGQIDRLDHDPADGRLAVIDYKYSRVERYRAAIHPERCGVDRFQIDVYMLAARRWAADRGLPDVAGVEGWVHCLREPRVLGPRHAPDPADTVRSIAAVIEEAAACVFDPTPAEPDDCRLCDFRRGCRIATVSGPLPAGLLEDEL